MKLEVIDTYCGYDNNVILKNISLNLNSGEIISVLGPNGVGKTTFFKTILGFLKLQQGKILLDGQDIFKISRKEFAKKVAYVPQAHTPPFPYSVIDVVLMGRTAHIGNFSSPSKRDIEICEDALERLKISFLRNKIYTEISGGERQLVLIARALAQQSELLIMDEPTSNLDFGNQVRVLNEINSIKNSGIGVMMTSHFPDHAFLCSTKVVAISKNKVFKVGTTDKIVTEDTLRKVYGIDVKIISALNEKDNSILKACVPIF